MTGPINGSTAAFANLNPVHGLGKKVAEVFEEASLSAGGYKASADVAEIGLQAVASHHCATENEKLIAKVVLQQAQAAISALTQAVMKDSPQGSRYFLLNEGLSYIAAGGAANGPIAVILADLGNRQMDTTRVQSWNVASSSEVRDSNVVGYSMLQQISQKVEDPNVQLIAGQALKPLGDRYGKSASVSDIERYPEVLNADAVTLHRAFDAIKIVAGAGDAKNPKVMAMLLGDLPSDSDGSYSVGRPGGGYAEYTSPEKGFGVTREVGIPAGRKWVP